MNILYPYPTRAKIKYSEISLFGWVWPFNFYMWPFWNRAPAWLCVVCGYWGLESKVCVWCGLLRLDVKSASVRKNLPAQVRVQKNPMVTLNERERERAEREKCVCVCGRVCVCVSVLDLVSLRTQHAAALSSLLLLRDNVAVQVTYLKYEIFS